MKPILNTQYNLYRKDSEAFCDSLQVAETFGKKHKNVIRDIENLDCSKGFAELNFERSNYKDSSGKRNPKYFMTKDGFTFLVMGYRGKRAAEFKEQYIKRFNQMAQFITVLTDVKEDFPEFTEAVKMAYAENKAYHYINEINMLYSLVLGQSVQSFKKERAIIEGNIREHLTAKQLLEFRKLQRADIGLLMVIPELKERREVLKQNHAVTRVNAGAEH